MCLKVTCWERADLLALVCGVELRVCHFPIGILGQVWYLIVSILDLCTLTYFLTLAQELLVGLDKKHQHDLIILDFSKAFDSVPHQRLMRNLDHYGIRGSAYNWIEAFLTHCTQQVLVECATSDSFPVISGVPQ